MEVIDGNWDSEISKYCDWRLRLPRRFGGPPHSNGRIQLISLYLEFRDQSSSTVGNQKVAPAGILRSAAYFRHQPALYKRRKMGSGGAWRYSESLSYQRRGKSAIGTGGKSSEDSPIPLVCRRRVMAYCGERHSKMRADLFELRNCQSMIVASGDHSLDATTPMLDQSQLLKYPANDAVAEFGNSFLDIFDSQPERQQAGILNLQAVVEQSDADWSPLLRVVGMNNSVHDRLADRHHWKRPTVRSLHGPITASRVMCFRKNAIASSAAPGRYERTSVESSIRRRSLPANRPAWTHASGK